MNWSLEVVFKEPESQRSLGYFHTQAEALAAAQEFARSWDETGPLLVDRLAIYREGDTDRHSYRLEHLRRGWV